LLGVAVVSPRNLMPEQPGAGGETTRVY